MGSDNKRDLTRNDLEKLLGKRIATVETKSLTAAGENYGSVMLAVDATLESGKTMALVAKMFPFGEMRQHMFQSPTTMKQEIGVYQIISPEFVKIQEEQSVPPSERLNFFCRSPGARLSLKDGDEDQPADENSVLLLENLKLQGYRTGDRVTGFDLKHTEFLLKQLAKFHATAVAIKFKKPLVFRNKFLNVLKQFKITVGTKEEDHKNVAWFIEGLQTIPVCSRNMDAIKSLLEESVEFAHSDKFRPTMEPYATFMHNDFWTNNMMLKYSSEIDADPIDLKIVDFQVSQYGSPASDVLFFLFTSTQTGIVSQHIDHFLQLYHKNFVDWLRVLGCDTDKFSFEKFLNEVKIVAPLMIFQTLFILMAVTFNKEQIAKQKDGPLDKNGPLKFNDICVQKISEAIETYVEKHWL